MRYDGLRKPGQNMGWRMTRAEGAVVLEVGQENGEWGVPPFFGFPFGILFEKTWPRFGVGDGQGCRGDGVGQGAGMWSIDSTDHQKPGESC